MTNKAIGGWVRWHRERLGLTRDELARKACVSRAVIRHLEMGPHPVSARLAYKVRRAMLMLDQSLAAGAPVLEDPRSPPHSMYEAELAFPPLGASAQLVVSKDDGRLGLSINIDALAIGALLSRVRQRLDLRLDGEILNIVITVDDKTAN